MKTLNIETTNGIKKEVEVYFNSLPSGHGHYKITCTASFEGYKKDFVKTTNDMPWIDSLSEFKYENDPSFDDLTEFYFEKFGDYFEMYYINDWVQEVVEEEEIKEMILR